MFDWNLTVFLNLTEYNDKQNNHIKELFFFKQNNERKNLFGFLLPMLAVICPSNQITSIEDYPVV